jgi:hypothetical protein
MDQCLNYGELRIPYRVCFSPERRKKVAIHVYPDGSVQVDAPSETALGEVKRAVLRRARWLSRHVERVRAHNAHILPREYISGESHFYLGRRYVLKVRKNQRECPSVKLRHGRLEAVTDRADSETVRNLLWDWYRQHAYNLFAQRLESLVDELIWVTNRPEWKLLTMKKRWGSCSPSGVLNLNPHLVKAPSSCIDYVLLHELCHLKFHSHGKSFYRLLSREMPGWESVKARLDGMAALLLNS